MKIEEESEAELEAKVNQALEEIGERFGWRFITVKLRVNAAGQGSLEWTKSQGKRK